ncbi:MAG: zinc ribbon domain-containing protein, partial [Actinomycetota bacterium]|nr:zinc ribbon domain-containing protein [Actinomycetota bacterium]
MTGLMKRIFRRREPGQPPRHGVASLFRGRRARGQRLPGYRRIVAFKLPGRLKRWPWQPTPAPASDATQDTEVVAAPAPQSFKDRGRLRRHLRFLRRARELGFRDIGGLIFDMRRFKRSRPDLLDAKLDALLAVDQELRALERILDDRRPFHELREPGISSCARCGALHSSEANFCPHCGLQFGGPREMGEVGGAIAAPPQAPVAPHAAQTSAAPGQQEWPWP